MTECLTHSRNGRFRSRDWEEVRQNLSQRAFYQMRASMNEAMFGKVLLESRKDLNCFTR